MSSKQKLISDSCDIRNLKLEAILALMYCLTFGLQFSEISFILHFSEAVAENKNLMVLKTYSFFSRNGI